VEGLVDALQCCVGTEQRNAFRRTYEGIDLVLEILGLGVLGAILESSRGGAMLSLGVAFGILFLFGLGILVGTQIGIWLPHRVALWMRRQWYAASRKVWVRFGSEADD
jgi:hypothetical protein